MNSVWEEIFCARDWVYRHGDANENLRNLEQEAAIVWPSQFAVLDRAREEALRSLAPRHESQGPVSIFFDVLSQREVELLEAHFSASDDNYDTSWLVTGEVWRVFILDDGNTRVALVESTEYLRALGDLQSHRQ